LDNTTTDVIVNNNKELVGSIDQGTSSSRFILLTSAGKILSSAQVEFDQYFPTTSVYNNNNNTNNTTTSSSSTCVGWHEHDPFDIWDSVVTCITRTYNELASLGLDLTRSGDGGVSIKTIGITNQRETTICWNNRTGAVYYNAIVWDDTRTATVADTIISENSSTSSSDDKKKNDNNKYILSSKTGLPIASYFAGTKVRWFIDNIPQLQLDLQSCSDERNHVRFGTVDTWLTYMLTGHPRVTTSSSSEHDIPRLAHEGGVYKTDVTNASRWLFMNLATLEWDEDLVAAICGGSSCWDNATAGSGTIPIATALPQIVPSSDITIGTIHGIPCPNNKLALQGVPIGAILGDQQAALFGQACYSPGEAKCTYGTGLFLMMNTGSVPTFSTHGLLTTVAYQLSGSSTTSNSNSSKPVYALEGSVAFSGSTIGWLRDRLELITSASETETLALSISSNDGMYLVPAFSGLFAPHWRPDARGCMVGLTASHTKAHIFRSALESSAYQAREVFDAMVLDSGVQLKEMRVDGGATANAFMMQFQCDILNVPVVRPEFLETTALGVAFAAGLSAGVWNSLDEIGNLWKADTLWNPGMSVSERETLWKGWNKAVQRSLNWVDED
jgi:glycerol kinase